MTDSWEYFGGRDAALELLSLIRKGARDIEVQEQHMDPEAEPATLAYVYDSDILRIIRAWEEVRSPKWVGPQARAEGGRDGKKKKATPTLAETGYPLFDGRAATR